MKKIKTHGHEIEQKEYFKVHPLDPLFYQTLLILESKIIDMNFNIQTVNNILNLYTQCVEYYDAIKDPISQYFQEKIKLILNNKVIIKIMMMNQNDQIYNDNESNQTEDIEQQQIKYKERNIKTQMFMQIEEKLKNNDSQSIVKDQNELIASNNNLILDSLKNQLSSIQQRLQNRKIMKEIRIQKELISEKQAELIINQATLEKNQQQQNQELQRRISSGQKDLKNIDAPVKTLKKDNRTLLNVKKKYSTASLGIQVSKINITRPLLSLDT